MSEITYEKGRVYDIPIGSLNPDPEQPRKHIDSDSLQELQESIKEKGIIQPLLFRRTGNDELYIVAGERRFQAAKNINLDTVPCLYVDGNTAEIALIENMLRKDLTAIEEAEALQRMLNIQDYTQERLAKILGKGRSTITEILSITKLPEVIKNQCRENPKCSRRLLVEIAKLETEEEMIEQFNHLDRKGLTRDEVRLKRRKHQVERLQPTRASIKGLKTSLLKLESDITDDDRQSLAEELQELVTAIQRILTGNQTR